MQAHIQRLDLPGYHFCYQSYFHNCVITAVILSGQDQSVCAFAFWPTQASYLLFEILTIADKRFLSIYLAAVSILLLIIVSDGHF